MIKCQTINMRKQSNYLELSTIITNVPKVICQDFLYSVKKKPQNAHSFEKLNENTKNINKLSERMNYLCQKQWIILLQILKTIMFMIIQTVV